MAAWSSTKRRHKNPRLVQSLSVFCQQIAVQIPDDHSAANRTPVKYYSFKELHELTFNTTARSISSQTNILSSRIDEQDYLG
jgi:hypothetical protein